MSFRKYGGLNYSPSNNIVHNHYNTIDNMSVTDYIGQNNSRIVCLSNLNVNTIFFDDGSYMNSATGGGGGESVFQVNPLTSTVSLAPPYVNYQITCTSDFDLNYNNILNVNTLFFEDGTSMNTASGGGGGTNYFSYNNNIVTLDNNYNLQINGSIQCNNDITCSNLSATSDYRLKTNIEPIPPSSTIDNLKPVQYIKNGKQEFGFLAHELQELYPDLVYGEKDGEQMQSVNYIGLIALLTKEIQDLKTRVKTLEEEKN